MRKSILLSLIILFALGCLVLYPVMGIDDRLKVGDDTKDCLLSDARLLFDNPLERLIVLKIVILDRTEEGHYRLGAYTIGGLRYAEIEVSSNGRSRVTRRLF